MDPTPCGSHRTSRNPAGRCRLASGQGAQKHHKRQRTTRRGTDGLHDSSLEGDGFELVWGFSCQVIVFGLKPVLCSEVCPGKASMFSRRQSCRGKSQSPVVRIAEEMETEPSK